MFYTVQELSDVLGVPVNSLYHWRQRKYGPTPARIGRRLLYRASDVRAWVDQQFADV